jgi:hypothetical protein
MKMARDYEIRNVCNQFVSNRTGVSESVSPGTRALRSHSLQPKRLMRLGFADSFCLDHRPGGRVKYPGV